MPISTSRNVTASGGQLTLGDLRAAVTAADGMSDDVVILGESIYSRLYIEPVLTKIVIADRPRVASCDDASGCYADAVTTVGGRVYCAEHAPAVES